MEELQGILHDYRKEIDAVTNKVVSLKDMPQVNVAAREVAISVTKLQEAKMWLGKALEATGSPFPAELADKAGATPAKPSDPASGGSATPSTNPAQPGANANQAAAPATPGGNAPAQPAAPADPNANGNGQSQ